VDNPARLLCLGRSPSPGVGAGSRQRQLPPRRPAGARLLERRRRVTLYVTFPNWKLIRLRSISTYSGSVLRGNTCRTLSLCRNRSVLQKACKDAVLAWFLVRCWLNYFSKGDIYFFNFFIFLLIG